MAKDSKPAQVHSRTVSLSVAAMLVALGVTFSMFKGIFSVPIGPTEVFPMESTINVIAGVMLGPWYAMMVAFFVSMIRIGLTTGTIFSLPGSLPGAFLVGFVYRYLWKNPAAGLVEIIGTGIIGAILSSLIFAPLFGYSGSIVFFVSAFIPPSVIGSIVGYIVLLAIKKMVRRRRGLQFP
ncbi:MAG: energy coupling factor transporter S component ThiW [Thaumarchaeota archaeon]|nr:energy coupling factor transporter S component ThiW [Nitrososphaerota archaeon]